MEVATTLWSNEAPDNIDYFDAAHIGNFSKAFQALYREAAKHPAFADEGETGSPLDYDAITNSQDGCPLTGLTIAEQGTRGKLTIVDASFRSYACFEDSDETTRDAVSTVRFDVVFEGGRPVIADFHRFDDGQWDSMADELKAIAGGK